MLVFPTGATLDSVARIPSATARLLFDALPEDGTMMPIRDVCARTGISRQLANYHVARLHKHGFVRTEPVRGGGRSVARVILGSTGSVPHAA